MIFIENFEDDIDYLILQRGKSYFDEGTIVEFDIENDIVDAVVSGTYVS